jgi:CBS domain containing-hemolysin-like protein
MTPRTDVEAIAPSDEGFAGDPRGSIAAIGRLRGIPVYGDSLDTIVGSPVLCATSMPYFGRERRRILSCASVLREPLRVPETKPIGELPARLPA